MEKKQVVTIVSENIKRLMNQKGLSNADLSRKSGIASGTVSKILNGNMSITIPMALMIADSLEVNISDLLNGLGARISIADNMQTQYKTLYAGIVSINNKRITCVKDSSGKVLGVSELHGGLDLVESASKLMGRIEESISVAIKNKSITPSILKCINLNLVMQSFEFKDTLHKFKSFAERKYNTVLIIPDWQITYLSAFSNHPGVSLVVDKGVSLSYFHENTLHKLGGWKYPIYDIGGENWLGVEVIHHTIEAIEGYIPMTQLAKDVISRFGGSIEKITELCFKGVNRDVYCLFTEVLLYNFLMGDSDAINIIQSGYEAIARLVDLADKIIGRKLNISINGSLSRVYSQFIDSDRILKNKSIVEKAELLATLSIDYLKQHGIFN